MVADGKKLGMKITRFDNNLDGPTALRNAGLMVQDKPTVAIDWNTVVGVGNAVRRARSPARKIPCLAVNQQIKGCHWFNLSNEAMGLGAAQVIDPIAKARGWNGHNTTIVMVIAAANGREVNNWTALLLRLDVEGVAVLQAGDSRLDRPYKNNQIVAITASRSICKNTIDGHTPQQEHHPADPQGEQHPPRRY